MSVTTLYPTQQLHTTKSTAKALEEPPRQLRCTNLKWATKKKKKKKVLRVVPGMSPKPAKFISRELPERQRAWHCPELPLSNRHKGWAWEQKK